MNQLNLAAISPWAKCHRFPPLISQDQPPLPVLSSWRHGQEHNGSDPLSNQEPQSQFISHHFFGMCVCAYVYLQDGIACFCHLFWFLLIHRFSISLDGIPSIMASFLPVSGHLRDNRQKKSAQLEFLQSVPDKCYLPAPRPCAHPVIAYQWLWHHRPVCLF